MWQVIGHDWAVDLLDHSIETGRISHAYLITGLSSIGKTTLATQFAQALHCAGPDAPCGNCRSCRLIDEMSHPDVHLVSLDTVPEQERRTRREIGINQIRELRHTISLKPYAGKWKVCLILEANRLSEEAANCLLKTLEEPPPHSVLILTAVDGNMLLPTITSRCQRLDLRPVATETIRRVLVKTYGVEEDEAHVVAHLAVGRVGWALRTSQDGEHRREQQRRLARLWKMGGASRVERMALAQELSQQFAKDIEEREGVQELLESWSGWWRDVLLIKEGCHDLVVNVDQLPRLREYAGQVPAGQASHALNSIRATQSYLDQNVNPRLALEVLILGFPTIKV